MNRLFGRQTAQAIRTSRASFQVRTNSSSAANKAGEAAKSAQQKAGDALASAQTAAGKGFETLKSASGKAGETAANMLGGYREPVLYNLSVAREFLKQVYIREGLAPPTNLAEVQSTYSTLFARARDINYWKGIAESGELVKVGIYGLEAYFIFHVGEMIGRRHMVGYKLD